MDPRQKKWEFHGIFFGNMLFVAKWNGSKRMLETLVAPVVRVLDTKKIDRESHPADIKQSFGSMPALDPWPNCLTNFSKSAKIHHLKSGTLPETNSSHLKMDGWKTSLVSVWDGFVAGANC